MQEAKPTAVRNFQINNVITEAFHLLSGSKWPIIGSFLALMSVMTLIPLAEFILYSILVETGGNIMAGMIVMGSAIGLTGLYFCSGIAAGIFKIAIEHARKNPISVRMGFQYFSRGLPLLFTSLLYFLLSFLLTLPLIIFNASISNLLAYLFYFAQQYRQLIILVLVIAFFASCLQASKGQVSYRAPLIIFIISILFFLFFGFSKYIFLLTQIALFIFSLIISTIVSAFLYLSLPLSADKTKSPFKAIFISLKTIRPHWFKVFLLLMTQYFIMLMTIILVLLGGLSNGYVITSLGFTIMIISQIWVIPLIFLMLGVTYHKLID